MHSGCCRFSPSCHLAPISRTFTAQLSDYTIVIPVSYSEVGVNTWKRSGSVPGDPQNSGLWSAACCQDHHRGPVELWACWSLQTALAALPWKAFSCLKFWGILWPVMPAAEAQLMFGSWTFQTKDDNRSRRCSCVVRNNSCSAEPEDDDTMKSSVESCRSAVDGLK